MTYNDIDREKDDEVDKKNSPCPVREGDGVLGRSIGLALPERVGNIDNHDLGDRIEVRPW